VSEECLGRASSTVLKLSVLAAGSLPSGTVLSSASAEVQEIAQAMGLLPPGSVEEMAPSGRRKGRMDANQAAPGLDCFLLWVKPQGFLGRAHWDRLTQQPSAWASKGVRVIFQENTRRSSPDPKGFCFARKDEEKHSSAEDE